MPKQQTTRQQSTWQTHPFPWGLALIVLLITGPVRAEDESENKEALDGAAILSQLSTANADKDLSKLGRLSKQLKDDGATIKEPKARDAIVKEVKKSLKVCKGNWGTIKNFVAAAGVLGGKSAGSMLKKLALEKEAKDEDHLAVQLVAVEAMGALADTRLLRTFEDLCKHRNADVANAAYKALGGYAGAKGKTRKKIAAMIMKRMTMEKPSSGGQGGKSVSAEATERWNKVQMSIVKTMQLICKEPTISDAANWEEWFGENKSRSPAWKDPK